jgi:2,3-bisphosphoglycerate-dependent phosphoglycerate mutase
MRRVILVRHGESELNTRQRQESVFCGQLETPLTDFGRRQAVELGDRLAEETRYTIECAVSSSLSRAHETLELILSRLPTQPTKLPAMSAFNERSLGIFEGRREAEVFAEYPEYRDDPSLNRFRADFHQKAPGGESLAEVTVRASQGFRECLNQSSGTLMIVAHCQTIRCLLAEKLNIEMHQALQIKIPHAGPIILVQSTDQEWRQEPWHQ